jgi:hypothetical protein
MKGAKRATKTKKRRIAKAVVPRGSLKRILKFDHTCPKNVTSVLSRFSIKTPFPDLQRWIRWSARTPTLRKLRVKVKKPVWSKVKG